MKMIFVLIALFAGIATAQAQGQQPVKEWTFLVYLNADNNLYRFGLINLQQMAKVGSNDNLNVVVEFDHAPRNKPTERLYVLQNQAPQVISSVPETNMGDWQHLAEFVTWGMKTFPARHYALVICNHGAGWEGISYDDNPSASIRIPDVAKALRQASLNLTGNRNAGPIIDILNFDACLMSGLETAFELKDHAKIMIGSQYNEPGEGEDYNAILGKIAQEPQVSPRLLAEHMVYEYVRQFPARQEINYLALDMSKVGNFTQVFRGAAVQHLAAAAPVKQKLQQIYRSVIGDDLIGAMTSARRNVGDNPPFAAALDQVINTYGYPAESAADFVRGWQEGGNSRALRITRAFPAVVRYRASARAQWQTAALQAQGDGTYSVSVPAPFQYKVQRSTANFREGAGSPEALATMIRAGDDPVIFHNNFPEGSPVIAEAHNVRTKGSTGLSLYFNSGGMAVRDRGPRIMQLIAADYRALQFAQVGAPEWTNFIGIR
jgi:hypothetical protein